MLKQKCKYHHTEMYTYTKYKYEFTLFFNLRNRICITITIEPFTVEQVYIYIDIYCNHWRYIGLLFDQRWATKTAID